jgi:hypothetical protein
MGKGSYMENEPLCAGVPWQVRRAQTGRPTRWQFGAIVIKMIGMTEITTTDRDQRGRYKTGNIGGGRPKGARSKLGEAFLEDLRDAWNERGATALARCAEEEPGTFCKIIASLLPKSIDINVAVDVAEFATKFHTACAMLGNDPPRPRKRLPGQPLVIEHDDGS